MREVTTTPRLTLGLPVYNGERYLAESLDSLLAQTFRDYEIIISDNASTDGTGAIARAYARKDPRIRYLRHPHNRGSTYNHNFVVAQARGQFFKWVSDDDLYAPQLLQRCMEALEEQPEVVSAHAWTAHIDDTGQVVQKRDYPLATASPNVPERFRSLLYTDGGDDMYGIFPMAVLRRIAPFDSYHLADRTFVSELALHGPFFNVPDFLYFRREHSARVSRSPSVRARCARWDPRRADRLRHPVIRLLTEYVLGYVTGIWRAPISWRDRMVCYWYLTVWVLSHVRRLTPSRRPEGLVP